MQDIDFMREALRIARNAYGRTSPNPMVGAVLVRDGRIIAEGWHWAAGTPHAEIHALRMAGELARGGTLYVTLEPCAHFGRTGPCAKALLDAGVTRVVIAMEDPNPLVAGRGIEMLRAGGIQVSCGLCEAEARNLNEAYIKWVTTKLPFVTMKVAMSLDGKIATYTGDSQWITGKPARACVHEWRDASDAILVGIGTVLADDPSLTARLPRRKGRNPIRVILDSNARIPLTEKVLTDGRAPTIIAVSEAAPKENVDALLAMGADVLIAGKHKVDLPRLLGMLGEREICSIFVEGGGRVHDAMLSAGLVDKVHFFIAPLLIGGENACSAIGGKGFATLSEAVRLEQMQVQQIGEDYLVTGYVRR